MRKRLAVVALAPLIAAGCGDGAAAQAEVVAVIPVDPHVGPDIQVAADGSVWLPASDTFAGTEVPYDEAANVVVRIDPEREKVAAVVPVAHPMTALAVGEGGVWATGTDFGPDDAQPRGSVVRVDPDTNQVDVAVDLGEGSSPSDVVVGFDSVWVSDSTADAVYRIDPDTGAVVATIAVDGSPTSLAVTDDGVWVAKPGTHQVRAIDPDTNEPRRPVGTGPDPSVLEAGGAGLFVADYAENDLSLISEDGNVDRSVDFPTAPSRIDVGEDVVVVAEVGARTLSVLRGDDRDVVLEGRVLVALALDGTTVWAADAGRGAVLRIRLPAG